MLEGMADGNHAKRNIKDISNKKKTSGKENIITKKRLPMTTNDKHIYDCSIINESQKKCYKYFRTN